MEGFGLDQARFVPQQNSDVRVHAHNVRRRLAEYYQAEGKKDPVFIEYIPGSYLPSFRLRARPRALAWMLAAAAAAALAGVGLLNSRVHHDMPALEQMTFDGGMTSHPSISRDGSLMAYNSDRAEPGNLDIWVQRLQPGAEPVRLTADKAQDTTPDISPDGRYVAFRSTRDNGGVYVVSVADHEIRLVAERGYGPRFSPNGKWIAYSARKENGATGVYLIPVHGGSAVDLRPESPHSSSPVWSPGGDYLIFLSSDATNPGGYDWWMASMDLSDGLKVLPGIAVGAAKLLRQAGVTERVAPTEWHGERLFFVRNQDNTARLWEVRISLPSMAATGPVRELPVAGIAGSPRAEPYRKPLRIYFSQEVRTNHIWAFPLDEEGDGIGGDGQRITNDASLRPGIFNRFSLTCDGQRLLFCSSRLRNWDLWEHNIREGHAKRVTYDAAIEDHPVFAGTGRAFAFLKNQHGDEVIEVRKVGGANKSFRNAGTPKAWVGNRLLTVHNNGLWFVDTNNNDRKLLFKRAGWTPVEAAVSPDEKWLALTVDPETYNMRGYLVLLRSGELAPIAEWLPVAEEPFHLPMSWSVDSKRLFFFHSHEGYRCLASRAVSGSTTPIMGKVRWLKHFHSYLP